MTGLVFTPFFFARHLGAFCLSLGRMGWQVDFDHFGTAGGSLIIVLLRVEMEVLKRGFLAKNRAH